MPDEIVEIIKCNNPKCITNNEPMKTWFHVIDKENVVLQCHYCELKIKKRGSGPFIGKKVKYAPEFTR